MSDIDESKIRLLNLLFDNTYKYYSNSDPYINENLAVCMNGVEACCIQVGISKEQIRDTKRRAAAKVAEEIYK